MMHKVYSARPSPALRTCVRAYAQREIYGCPSPIVEAVPARLEQVLNFEFGDGYELRFSETARQRTRAIAILGYQTHRRCDIVLAGKIESFAIFFRPTGFSRLFHIPVHYLRDQIYEAGAVLGDIIYGLWTKTGEATSFQDRVQIVEEFLLHELARGGHQDPFTEAADRMLARAGAVRIADLADQSGISLRHFERRFQAAVGCSPKHYARVARFQTALDMKLAMPNRSWLAIAHELGYHDQMHMVHDFQSLAGNAPGRLLTELGDIRPHALADRRQHETLDGAPPRITE